MKELLLEKPPQYAAHLMFEIANAGDHPVQIRTIGWQTGWLRWGPSFFRSKHAIQLTGGCVPWGADPPYELQPGMAQSSNASMQNVIQYAGERIEDPLFTRDWPILGRLETRVRAFAYTADGFTVFGSPDPSLVGKLVEAEKNAAR